MANGYNATLGGEGKQFYNYDDIIEKYSNGLNITEITKLLDISKDTVVNALHSKDVQIIQSSEIAKEKLSKRVKCLDIKTKELLNIFSSVNDAARYVIDIRNNNDKVNGIARHISQNCRNERKTAYGFIWQFE